MKSVIFLVLTLAAVVALAVPAERQRLDRDVTCASALSGNPRFRFGQVTHRGVDAETYFASPATTDGRSRFVMMIGIPGSGKSHWAEAADPNEWEIISIDAIRKGVIAKMNSGDEVAKDDPALHFSPEVLREGQRILEEKIARALREHRSVILDQNNLTPFRSLFSTRARAAGYRVDALVFSSSDPQVNLDNILSRSGHAVRDLDEQAVRDRFHQFNFYNRHLYVDHGNAPEPPAPAIPASIEPFLRLAMDHPNFQSGYVTLPAGQREELDAVLALDGFHNVDFVWTPERRLLPWDSPVLRERPRLYAALTNKCNRACPWCCVYSNPYKNTFLTPEQLKAHFPADRDFDLQLEGGEPTIHPRLFEFVEMFRADPHAGNLVLVTNGVKLPRELDALKEYLEKFGEPFTVKLSVNHYLLDNDKNLLAKAQLLRRAVRELGGRRQLILNVRLRKGSQFDDDAWVLNAVKAENLADISNIFFLQSYGLASQEDGWEPPFTVNNNFVLVNPDGSAHTGSLTERADKMGDLE